MENDRTIGKRLTKAIKIKGDFRAFGRALGVSHQAVKKWTQSHIPAERVLAVEALTGVPREELRPDIYPPQDRKRSR